MVINGSATNIDLMQEEDIDNMDAFLALSYETEKNILASLAAKESGVKKTISQVENIDFIPLAQNMGLNTTINIKYLAANFIFKSIYSIGILVAVQVNIVVMTSSPGPTSRTRRPISKASRPLATPAQPEL